MAEAKRYLSRGVAEDSPISINADIEAVLGASIGPTAASEEKFLPWAEAWHKFTITEKTLQDAAAAQGAPTGPITIPLYSTDVKCRRIVKKFAYFREKAVARFSGIDFDSNLSITMELFQKFWVSKPVPRYQAASILTDTFRPEDGANMVEGASYTPGFSEPYVETGDFPSYGLIGAVKPSALALNFTCAKVEGNGRSVSFNDIGWFRMEFYLKVQTLPITIPDPPSYGFDAPGGGK